MKTLKIDHKRLKQIVDNAFDNYSSRAGIMTKPEWINQYMKYNSYINIVYRRGKCQARTIEPLLVALDIDKSLIFDI